MAYLGSELNIGIRMGNSPAIKVHLQAAQSIGVSGCPKAWPWALHDAMRALTESGQHVVVKQEVVRKVPGSSDQF
jgi:hypothetical protein